MALNPIDLQVNFLQMANYVSKEQAEARQAMLVNQDINGQKTVEKTLEENKKVNKTENTDEGLGKINTKQKEGNSNEAGHKKEKKEFASDDDKEKSIVKDPELGRYIDFSR